MNWDDPKEMVSKYFSVRECLYLPSWNCLASEAMGLNNDVKANLTILCNRMDKIRDFLGASIIVHVTYRPPNYNEQVGGAKNSYHMKGLAMDWHLVNLYTSVGCDQVRERLLPKLDEFQMRMEDGMGTTWIHTDFGEVVNNRFFKP